MSAQTCKKIEKDILCIRFILARRRTKMTQALKIQNSGKVQAIVL